MLEHLSQIRISNDGLDTMEVYMNHEGDVVFTCENHQFLTTINKEEWLEMRTFIDNIFDTSNED